MGSLKGTLGIRGIVEKIDRSYFEICFHMILGVLGFALGGFRALVSPEGSVRAAVRFNGTSRPRSLQGPSWPIGSLGPYETMKGLVGA